MTDGPVKRAAERHAAELLAPLLAARPAPDGWRLVSWDAEQGITVSLGRGDVVVTAEFEPPDASQRAFARTPRFNVNVRRSVGPEGPLTADERRAVDQLVSLVRRRERALPVVPRAEARRGSEVREVLVDRVLMPEGGGRYYLNPYAGCMVGCAFCYVADRADLSRAFDGAAALPWGRWVDVKVNAPEVLRDEVKRHAPGVVRMSPIVTDPYQSIERRYRVTRGCLEVLVDAGFEPVVLTREARVREDYALLARARRAGVGFSIPTDDDAVRAAFEPGADPIEARFEALAEAHARGLATAVVIQPVLPMNVARFVDRVAPYVRLVRIDRMYRPERWQGLYDAVGCPDGGTEAFYARTAAALREGFAARGVRCHDLDDLAAIFEAR